MDFFPDPHPKISFASTTSSGIYNSDGDGAKKHELDFIPFAKSSNTFVKQAGGYATNSGMQAMTDDRWGTGFPDDARVPRLGGSDHEDSLSTETGHAFSPRRDVGISSGSNTYVTTPTAATNTSTMDSFLGNNTNATNGFMGNSNIGPPIISISCSPRHLSSATRTSLDHGYQQSVPSPPPLSLLSSQIQQAQAGGGPTAETPEVVYEMPPPKLANPRSRKGIRSTSLNKKYAHMKSDMELMAQLPYSYHRAVRTTLVDQPLTAVSARWSVIPAATTSLQPSSNPTVQPAQLPTASAPWSAATSSIRSLNIPPVQHAQSHTFSAQGAPVQQACGQASFGGYQSRGTEQLQRGWETKPTLSVLPPKKRVRIDEGPTSHRASIGNHGGVGGGGGAFSTPHFRMSTPSRATGVPSPSPHMVLPAQNDQGARTGAAEGEEEYGLDNWGVGDFLLDPEPMLVPSPQEAFATQGHDEGLATTAQTSNNNDSNFFIHQSEGSCMTNDGFSQDTPVQGGDQGQPPSQDPVLSSISKTSAQDERAMTLRDRIQQLGSEIRASAAATVPRFGLTPIGERGRPTGEDHEGQDRNQEQQRQQQQEQQRPRTSQRSRMDFRLLSDSRRFERMRNDVNVTGVTSWATDNAPVPRADTADVATIVAAASQQQTSLSQQAAEYKEGCLDDKTAEYQASDMGLLDGIEKDIQDLADF